MDTGGSGEGDEPDEIGEALGFNVLCKSRRLEPGLAWTVLAGDFSSSKSMR